MPSPQKIEELTNVPISGIINNVEVDGEVYNLRVDLAPNSCTNSKNETCIWRNSREGCPRLGFCIRKYGKAGRRTDGNFVCYIIVTNKGFYSNPLKYKK